MRKVIVKSWQEASDYLQGGRNPNDRPLDSYLRLRRVIPDDPDSPLQVGWKDDPNIWQVTFNKDGTLDIKNEQGGNSNNLTINQYADATGVYVFWKKRKLQAWLPAMGYTQSKKQKCRNCEQGKQKSTCSGARMCQEVYNFPAYLVETGAPGVACSHGENSVHFPDTCEHGEYLHHSIVGGSQCWNCSGSGSIMTRPRHLSVEWDGKPIRIKDGQLVQIGQPQPAAA